MFFRQNNSQRALTAKAPALVEASMPRRDRSRDEITLGVDVSTGEPFRVPRTLLGHMHVRGMSGTGKSSLTLISLIAQLIGYPIFIIDLGGDQNLFHNAKRLTEAGAKRFRYLTLDPKLRSYNFPPFQTLTGSSLNITEVSQRLIRAFNLDFGAAIYGASYYASQALAAMLSIAKSVFAANPDATLEDVDRHLNRSENRKAFKDADSIRMNVRFLLEYPQLATAPDPQENISIERGIEDAEVCYFFCPSLDDPIVSPLVGGIALATIIHIASERAKAGRPRTPIYVFVDEFAEIVGRSLGALLAQGRKYGLRFILANQSTSQLETKDVSLAHALFENTNIKQYFTSLGDDVEVLQSLSKDKIRSLGGSSVQGLSTSVSFKDTIVPTLERDQVLSVSATFAQSFFVLNDGKGHREPIVVQQTHEYPDLSELPMPRRDGAAEAATDQARNSPPTPAARNESPRGAKCGDTGAKTREARIAALIAKKRAEECWQVEAA